MICGLFEFWKILSKKKIINKNKNKKIFPNLLKNHNIFKYIFFS